MTRATFGCIDGLTKGLRLVHRMRRKLTEDERDRIAVAVIELSDRVGTALSPHSPDDAVICCDFVAIQI